jgi:hypothetical protein
MALNLADKSGLMAELWMNYRDDKNFSDFFGYNDIGLPISYYLAEGLITELSPLGEQYIIETCDMFLALIDVTEDEADGLIDINLDAVMDLSESKKNQSNPEV